MLINYLKIALRNLIKNSIYSFINIVGLSVGLACSILILLWVNHELSFDTFHTKRDRLYQVWENATYDGKVNTFNSVPFPSREELKTTSTLIQNATLTDWGSIHLLDADEKKVNTRGYLVGDEFLDMFDFVLIEGNQATALQAPNSIILTEKTATTLFEKGKALGKTIRIDNKYDVTVTGITKDVPSNSSFIFDYLIPLKLFESEDWVQEGIDDWGDNSWQVYVELKTGISKEQADAAIKNMLTKHGQTDVVRELILHPMEQWRLYTQFENGKASGGMIDYVRGFTIIAFFILIMACINFMNLATARSQSRAREVGIRKSIGSKRSELIFQFLGESVMITSFSFLLALVLVEISLPFYNTLVNKVLFIDYSNVRFWLLSILAVLLTGIVSGSYPAFYLSSFQPVKVLKGKLQVGKGVVTPRQVLVITQFVFATILIVGSIVIRQQIQFTKNRDLGYNQENLLSVWNNEELRKNYEPLKLELLASGLVTSVTKSNSPITEIFSNNFLSWPGKPETENVLFTTIATEYDYTQTMGITVLEGRDFSPEFPSDSTAVLVNKKAADIMNLKETLGTKVTFFGERTGTIIGVVDNVVMGSPLNQTQPMFVFFDRYWASTLTLRLAATNDIQTSIQSLQEIFKRYDTSHPFEYTFVDQQFAKKFSGIAMVNRLANLFTFLAILITGLGLFGLASFTAEQRTKEIGIRKVMGASVSTLVALISKEFSRLVIISFLISGPLAWWLLSSLLERYSYRINFPWWSLGLAGGISLVFALAIVSSQALKAASSNPVDSLRSE